MLVFFLLPSGMHIYILIRVSVSLYRNNVLSSKKFLRKFDQSNYIDSARPPYFARNFQAPDVRNGTCPVFALKD